MPLIGLKVTRFDVDAAGASTVDLDIDLEENNCVGFSSTDSAPTLTY